MECWIIGVVKRKQGPSVILRSGELIGTAGEMGLMGKMGVDEEGMMGN